MKLIRSINFQTYNFWIHAVVQLFVNNGTPSQELVSTINFDNPYVRLGMRSFLTFFPVHFLNPFLIEETPLLFIKHLKKRRLVSR